MNGEPLQYVEQSIAQWLDGLVMHGAWMSGMATIDDGAIVEDFLHAVRQVKSPQGMRA